MNLNPRITENPVARWATETISQDVDRIKQAAHTIALLSTREYWHTVKAEYPTNLPDSRFLRAATYIFTVEGQLAYKRAKQRHHPGQQK